MASLSRVRVPASGVVRSVVVLDESWFSGEYVTVTVQLLLCARAWPQVEAERKGQRLVIRRIVREVVD
jgi:hypothetical protein